MANPIGIVKSITGNVIATDLNGEVRVLQIGDTIFAGEVISNDSVDGVVVLNMLNGKDITLKGKEVLALDESATTFESFGDETQVSADSLSEAQKALLEGDFNPEGASAAGEESILAGGILSDALFLNAGSESNIYADDRVAQPVESSYPKVQEIEDVVKEDEPELEPIPQPEPQPEPIPEPQPEPTPEPQPIPEPTPIPVPQPQPIPEPQPEPKPEPKPEPAPKPSITVEDAQTIEGNELTHKVSLSNPSDKPETYDFKLESNTATQGDDFTNTPTFTNGVTLDPATGTITVPAGVTEFEVKYPTNDDVYKEDNETTKLTIGGDDAIGTIIDEPKPFDPSNPDSPEAKDNVVVNLEGDKSVNEGADATYTVSVEKTPVDTLTIDVTYTHKSTQDGDIVTKTKTISIPAGEDSLSFNVSAIDDTITEADEVYNVTISNPQGGGYENVTIGKDSVDTTIVDNDGKPSITVEDAQTIEGNELTHKVSLSNPSDKPETYDFKLESNTATQGDDFTNTPTFTNGVTLDPATGTITVPAGVTEFEVKYPTNDDVYKEDNETTKLTIGGDDAIGTIIDEPKPFDPSNPDSPEAKDVVFAEISVDKAQTPEGTKLQYTVKLVDENGNEVKSPEQDVEVQISWTGEATNEKDVSELPESVTIKANTNETQFSIDAKDDMFAEGKEPLKATITEVNDNGVFEEALPSPTRAVANSAIVDDINPDSPNTPLHDVDTVLVQLVNDDSTTEGGNLTHKVQLVDANGNVVVVPEGGEVTVEVSYAGKAENGVDFTGTTEVTIVGGQSEATFTNPTMDDSLIEGTEQYTVSIANVENVDAFESVSVDANNNSTTGEIVDNDALEWNDLTAVVSEEGLVGGNQDTTGVSDTTNSAIDTIDISDTKDVTFKFADIENADSGLDHKGVDVEWNKTSDTELVGKAGDVEVVKASMDANTGKVTTTLLQSVDHKDTSVEDVVQSSVKVEAVQGGQSVGVADVSISIEDDAPVEQNIITEIETDVQAPTLNIMIQLDRSWSMAADENGDMPIIADDHYNWIKNPAFDGTSRVEIARQGIMDMIEKYEESGTIVKVQLIAFNSNAVAIQGGKWLSKAELNDEIINIDKQLTGSENGGTNYKNALALAEETYENSTPPQADKTISYFISDGDNYKQEWKVEPENEQQWETFLQNNGIEKAYAIGFADAVITAKGLEAVAHKTTAEVVQTDEIQDKLVETVDAGNANDGKSIEGTLGEEKYGADGVGEISEVRYEGKSYLANEDGKIIIQTQKGGELIMDTKDGSYTYETINKNIVSHDGEQEQFEVVVKDADGDSVVNDLRIDINANKDLPILINKDSVVGEHYTVEAFAGDEVAEISNVARGFGVVKGAHGPFKGEIKTSDEIGTTADGVKTSIVVTFDQDISSADVKLGWLAPKVTATPEDDKEVAKIDLLDDAGNVLRTFTINGGSDEIDNIGKLATEDGSEFRAMKFYTDDAEYSDYVINEIKTYVAGDDRAIIGSGENEYIDSQEQSDVVDAKGGDDVIKYDSVDSLVDGGEGHDTLAVAHGSTIDFSNLSNIKNIEEIDVSNNEQSDALSISLKDVIEITDENNIMKITGDKSDSVSLDKSEGWKEVQSSEDGYKQFESVSQDGKTVIIEIQDTVQVDL